MNQFEIEFVWIRKGVHPNDEHVVQLRNDQLDILGRKVLIIISFIKYFSDENVVGLDLVDVFEEMAAKF